MLRDSLRGFLKTNWPVDNAVAWAQQPDAVVTAWQGLVGQGLAALGSEPTEGGMREIVVVMEELGRAASNSLSRPDSGRD